MFSNRSFCLSIVNPNYSTQESGKFDADAQAKAHRKAIEYALSTMPQSAIEYINKISGDVEKFIFSKIKARVAQNKIGG